MGFEKYTTLYGVYIRITMNNRFAVQLCIVLQQIATVCGNEYKVKTVSIIINDFLPCFS